MGGPLVERGALFVEVVVDVVGAGDLLLGVIQHALGDVGRDAQAREARAAATTQVVQRESSNTEALEAALASGEVASQELGIEGTGAVVGG